MLALASCSDDRVVLPAADTGASSSGAAGSSTTSDAMGTSSAPATTGSTTAAADADASTGALFLPPPGDAGDGAFQCDPFAQDCPAGEKCSPYGEGEHWGSWSGWRCTPLAPAPVAAGEPCHVEAPASSGIDDCERGATCYDVDTDTLEGTCVNLCVGSPTSFVCEDPGEACVIETGGPVVVCLPICDPRGQDCLTGQTCVPYHEIWICGPDVSGALGAYGDPCLGTFDCDPGLVCLSSSAVPPGLPCETEAGCCTEVCDLDDPAGDQQCAGAAGGQVCEPWYDAGEAPPGYEDLGACAVP